MAKTGNSSAIDTTSANGQDDLPLKPERRRTSLRLIRAVAKAIGYCSLAILIALYVVGAVSVPPGSLRHEVQTLPLWFPIAAGLTNKQVAKWAALPCFIFWLAIMIMIWLFLLGWARIVTGHFPPTEVAMTLVVGCASIVGIIACLRWRTAATPLRASVTFLVFAALQVLAMRLSLMPYVARR